MLLKPCSRCRALITYPSVYCDTCKPIAEKERQEAFQKKRLQWNSRYNAKRDPKYTRFYASNDWKRMSKAKMQDAGYRCEDCGAIAVEVHHVDPIQTESGWERRLDWSNLKALCLDCHNKSHGRFTSRAKGRAGHRAKPIGRFAERP